MGIGCDTGLFRGKRELAMRNVFFKITKQLPPPSSHSTETIMKINANGLVETIIEQDAETKGKIMWKFSD